MRFTLLVAIVLRCFLRFNCQCSDEIQGCTVITEEFESEIQSIKDRIFAQCFPSSSCKYEKRLFQICFARSVRALRAPFNSEEFGSDSFGDTAQRYRGAVDYCFVKSRSKYLLSKGSLNHVNDSAIFACAAYGAEFADRMWGLPEPFIEELPLQEANRCHSRWNSGRVFGNGLVTFLESAKLNL